MSARDQEDDGYILAAALATLLALSLVAAALVSTSSAALQRVKRAETAAADRLALRSAILAAGSQLALDPRRRQLDLEDGQATIVIGSRTVLVSVGWETTKLDANRLPPEGVAQLLSHEGVPALAASHAVDAMAQLSAGKHQALLIDDLGRNPQEAACLNSVLTVFGGQDGSGESGQEGAAFIGQPSPGSRLHINASLNGRQGLSSVILMTGDPSAPFGVLDWRPTSGSEMEACHGL